MAGRLSLIILFFSALTPNASGENSPAGTICWTNEGCAAGLSCGQGPGPHQVYGYCMQLQTGCAAPGFSPSLPYLGTMNVGGISYQCQTRNNGWSPSPRVGTIPNDFPAPPYTQTNNPDQFCVSGLTKSDGRGGRVCTDSPPTVGSGKSCYVNEDCHPGLGCSQGPFGQGYCRRRSPRYISGFPGLPGVGELATYRSGGVLQQYTIANGWKDVLAPPSIAPRSIPDGFETLNQNVAQNPSDWCRSGSSAVVEGAHYCKAAAKTCAYPQKSGIDAGQTYRAKNGTLLRCLLDGSYTSFIPLGSLVGGAEAPAVGHCNHCQSAMCARGYEDKALTFGNWVPVCKEVAGTCPKHLSRVGVAPGVSFLAGDFTILCDRATTTARVVGGGRATLVQEPSTNAVDFPKDRHYWSWPATPASKSYPDLDNPSQTFSLPVSFSNWLGYIWDSPSSACSVRFGIVGYDSADDDGDGLPDEKVGTERNYDILYQTFDGVNASDVLRLATAPAVGANPRVLQLQSEVKVGKRGWSITGVTPIISAHLPNQFFLPVQRSHYASPFLEAWGLKYFSPFLNSSYDESIVLRMSLSPLENCRLRIVDSLTFSARDPLVPLRALTPADWYYGDPVRDTYTPRSFSTRGVGELDLSLRLPGTALNNPFWKLSEGPRAFQQYIRSAKGGLNASLRTSNELKTIAETKNLSRQPDRGGYHYIWYGRENTETLGDGTVSQPWVSAYTWGARYYRPASPSWTFRPLADGSEWIVFNLADRKDMNAPDLFRWVFGDFDFPGIQPAQKNSPRTRLYLGMKDPDTQYIVDSTVIEIGRSGPSERENLYNSMVYYSEKDSRHYIYVPEPMRTFEVDIEPVY